MPMSGDVLGAAIKGAIDGCDPKDRDALFKAMGATIVDHIVNNATIIVAHVTGVQAGPAVSGPGTATIT